MTSSCSTPSARLAPEGRRIPSPARDMLGLEGVEKDEWSLTSLAKETCGVAEPEAGDELRSTIMEDLEEDVEAARLSMSIRVEDRAFGRGRGRAG